MLAEHLQPGPVQIAAIAAGLQPAPHQRLPHLGGSAGVPQPADKSHPETHDPGWLLLAASAEQKACRCFGDFDIERCSLGKREVAEHLVRDVIAGKIARDPKERGFVFVDMIYSGAFGCLQREDPADFGAGDAPRSVVLVRNLTGIGGEFGEARCRASMQDRTAIGVQFVVHRAPQQCVRKDVPVAADDENASLHCLVDKVEDSLFGIGHQQLQPGQVKAVRE